MRVFLTILMMLTLSWIINEIYVNILIFLYGWADNAPRIPKIYNIIGIWWTDQKLLTVRPIATLPDIMMKWKKRPKGRWKIYDESHISTRSAEALNTYHFLTDWLTDWLTTHLLKILSFPDWLTDWPANEDIVTFMNTYWSMCVNALCNQGFQKCITVFVCDQDIGSVVVSLFFFTASFKAGLLCNRNGPSWFIYESQFSPTGSRFRRACISVVHS